jgi:putative transposase
MRELNGEYAVRFNQRLGRSGHLWQDRFASTVMDLPHLAFATRYVECNPVRAGMVLRAEDYPWSSAAAHCGLRVDALLANDHPLIGEVGDWRSWLREDAPYAEFKRLRRMTKTGRPLGDDEFVREIERKTGRVIAVQPRGRQPRRAAVNAAAV